MKLGKQILKNTMVNLLAMYALEDLEKKISMWFSLVFEIIIGHLFPWYLM
jgi:glycerol-3-phosphate acyltransferase PlsY